jgi:hypothetical protein
MEHLAGVRVEDAISESQPHRSPVGLRGMVKGPLRAIIAQRPFGSLTLR